MPAELKRHQVEDFALYTSGSTDKVSNKALLEDSLHKLVKATLGQCFAFVKVPSVWDLISIKQSAHHLF